MSRIGDGFRFGSGEERGRRWRISQGRKTRELDEASYNGRRRKDPSAAKENTARTARPERPDSGDKDGLYGRKRHAIKREHSAE